MHKHFTYCIALLSAIALESYSAEALATPTASSDCTEIHNVTREQQTQLNNWAKNCTSITITCPVRPRGGYPKNDLTICEASIKKPKNGITKDVGVIAHNCTNKTKLQDAIHALFSPCTSATGL